MMQSICIREYVIKKNPSTTPEIQPNIFNRGFALILISLFMYHSLTQ